MPKETLGRSIFGNLPFSGKKKKIEKLLKKLKSKSRNPNSSPGEIKNLLSRIQSYINELPPSQRNSGEFKELRQALVRAKRAMELYEKRRRKAIDSDAEIRRKDSEERAEKQAEMQLEIVVKMLERFSEMSKEQAEQDAQKAKELASSSTSSWDRSRELLDKLKENEKALAIKRERINELKEEIISSGMLEDIAADHPEVAIDQLKEEIELFFTDRKVRAGRKFNEVFTRLGISAADTEKAIRKYKLEETVETADNEIVDSDQLEDDGKILGDDLLKDLLGHVKDIEEKVANKSEDLNEEIEMLSDSLARFSVGAFVDRITDKLDDLEGFFEDVIEDIGDALTGDNNETENKAQDKVETKDNTEQKGKTGTQKNVESEEGLESEAQELRDDITDLYNEVAGILKLFERKVGEENQQYQVLSARADKIKPKVGQKSKISNQLQSPQTKEAKKPQEKTPEIKQEEKTEIKEGKKVEAAAKNIEEEHAKKAEEKAEEKIEEQISGSPKEKQADPKVVADNPSKDELVDAEVEPQSVRTLDDLKAGLEELRAQQQKLEKRNIEIMDKFDEEGIDDQEIEKLDSESEENETILQDLTKQISSLNKQILYHF